MRLIITHLSVLRFFKINLKSHYLLILVYLFLSGCTVSFPSPSKSSDASLQAGLERIAKTLGISGAIKERRVGIALLDLTNAKRPAFAGLNENLMMYAASLPKIAILFGVFKQIEDGKLEWNEQIKQRCHDMIRHSSNDASSELLHLIGPEYLRDLLTSRRYRLYDKDRGGGLWVGKEYGKQPAFFRDPIYGIAHGATPLSVVKFYYLLDTGQLLDKIWSRRMRVVLSESAHNTKFVYGLTQCCPEARYLRKAGTWRDYYSDSVLVYNRGTRYILTALINDPNGEEWLEKLMPAVDQLIQDQFIKNKSLDRSK